MSRLKRQRNTFVDTGGIKAKTITPRSQYLLKKYGITSEQYDELLQQQGSCCAVCRKPASYFKARLAIDHDHRTGQIRGILCPYCNRRIVGRHRREQGASLLLSAYEYLTGRYTDWIVPKKKKHVRRKRSKKKL